MSKKIIAIGNAIVDVVCSVGEDVLIENNLIKSSMSLIDEKIAKNLEKLKAEKITSGGSAANTAATAAQFGSNCHFIGRVSNDDFGTKFINEIEKTKTKFIGDVCYNNSTAKSFILVTPDGERTMCTFLGCASNISEDLILEKHFKDSAILYIEGYLWDSSQNSEALKKAINLAKNNGAKIAFCLSDVFCVSRHKEDFLKLVDEVDIIFANENEIIELCDAKNFSDAKIAEFFAGKKDLIAIATRSEKGCAIFNQGKLIEVATNEVKQIVDATGAGDNFAAGFLSKFLEGKTLEECAAFGNQIAGKILGQFGARF